MKRPRIAVVGVYPPCRETGGAERLFTGLTNALNEAGAEAEYIGVCSDESCNEAVRESYARCHDLDLSRFDGVITTKAPAYALEHPNHVCYLTHTMRVFYDMFEHEFPNPDRSMVEMRRLIHALDTSLLQSPRTKARFVIGHEVRHRMLRYNGLDSKVLYPGLDLKVGRTGEYKFFLLPGRLHRWKRVDLAIQAMRLVNRPVQLKISGTGEDEARFRDLACSDTRVEFLGRVSDAELEALYANALAVIFPPIREDYGYVTFEAFRCRKPVITCHDSGEPARVVQHGVSGYVCAPNPEDMARQMNALVGRPHVAQTLGEAGLATALSVSWTNVAPVLLTSLGMQNT